MAERALSWLPAYEAPLSEWRDWLTGALRLTGGLRVEDFIRNGRQRTDGCSLVLTLPDGKRRSFALGEQRHLMALTSQRVTLIGATDGLVRMPALSKAESEDVWAALVTLATVASDQSKDDETREWIERFLGVVQVQTGSTMRPNGRFDALRFLKSRPLFNRWSALTLEDSSVGPERKNRPVLLLDRETGERWVRAAEVATFVRHCVGAPPISQATLDGRMGVIGVKRVVYEVRRDDEHPRVVLYRLAPAGEEGAP